MAVTISKSKFGNPNRAVKNATKKTNLELALLIAAQAKSLAPVDYGQLRNSISVTQLGATYLLNDNQNSKIKHIGENQGEALSSFGLQDSEAFVGTNSDHALHQEYGTVKQPAQPFLRPSAELILSKKKVDKIMSDYSREAMEKEFKKRKTTVKTYG